jgi:class 3 adenylate cyclase/phosphatidylglycerophosphate synthase
MSKTHRKLAAILFSDIQGFTALMRRDESGAMDLIRRHNVIMDAAVKRNDGRVIKTIGDSFMVIFDSAVSAVECALDAQMLLEDYNDDKKEDTQIHVRISVHLGDVLIEGDDVFGDGVNIASRLQGVTPAGRICISREVFNVVRGKVPRPFDSFGTHDFKGIPEPIEVFKDRDEDSSEAKKSAPQKPPSVFDAEGPALNLDFPQDMLPKKRAAQRHAKPPISDKKEAKKEFDDGLPRTFVRRTKSPDLEISHAPPASEGAEEPAATPPEREESEGIPHTEVRERQEGPITDVVLMVGHRSMMFERFGGMILIERQLHTLVRAGVKRVWVATHTPKQNTLDRLRLPAGIEIHWGSSELRCKPPYANISGDHLLRLPMLKRILRHKHNEQTSYRDHGKKGVVQIIPFRDESFSEFEKVRIPDGASVLLHSPVEQPASLKWLLDEARKPTDSFMAKHFDRNISLFATRYLLNTRVTPNQMTIFSTIIGLIGAALMTVGTYGFVLAGALTFWLHTVLDGCDGEIARLRFESSRWGGTLDFWGDNIVHFALFAALGYGQYQLWGKEVYAILGATAACSAFLSAMLVYAFSIEKAAAKGVEGPLFTGVEDVASKKASGFVRLLAKIEHTLTQRDFVYLLVALAAADQVRPFLWAAGIGTPLFLGVFILLLGMRKLLK